MNLNVLEKFKKVTGYDIRQFLEDYSEFATTYYPRIVDYYNGGSISNTAFTKFDYLKGQLKTIEALIDQYNNNFATTDFWDLNENISDIQTSLFTIDNLSRWLRSSRTDRFSSNLKIDYIQKQNETIERIAENFGFNGQDDWTNLAVQNQITEEDYTNNGGKMLNAFFPNNSNFDLENIVDNLSEENIYGKDVVSKIEIESDGGLKTVSGVESLQQTFKTIMSTSQGSVPEFEEDGIPSYLIGSNQNTLQYPVLFRSLLNMFQKDKRFISFEVLDIKKDQDAIFIETQTKTITGDDFVKSISI